MYCIESFLKKDLLMKPIQKEKSNPHQNIKMKVTLEYVVELKKTINARKYYFNKVETIYKLHFLIYGCTQVSISIKSFFKYQYHTFKKS